MKFGVAAVSLAALAAVVVAGPATYFFGGFFSVAASNQDPEVVNWALVHVRQASIARHATDYPPSSLTELPRVQAGARTYVGLGCQSCHGGLGAKPARFSQGLNPQPNLKAVIADISSQELFWVLRNGIKMTGMPSFGTGATPVPDDDLWNVVAFLNAVPTLSADDLAKLVTTHDR